MSKKLPPRLWLRNEKRPGREPRSVWVIYDDNRQHSTGCLADEIEAAGRKLAEYIASKHQIPGSTHAKEVMLSDVLSLYLEVKAEGTSDPKLTMQILRRLAVFWGDKTVSQIIGPNCRAYTKERGTASGARRDLEFLRAAVKLYKQEYGLDTVPLFTMPPKSLPRQRAMTRKEAALLLWAALGWEKQHNGTWIRRHDQKRSHIARLILIGLYTGTRPGAIRKLQKLPNTEGGWADLEDAVIYRKALNERVAHNKPKTPVKMAPRLLAHMKRWYRLDQGIRWYVHYNGRPVEKLNKAFRSAVAAAQLTKDITPHVLRHTRGTWLAHAGVPAAEAAASLGMTQEEYERTYLHFDPSFQKNAANAF